MSNFDKQFGNARGFGRRPSASVSSFCGGAGNVISFAAARGDRSAAVPPPADHSPPVLGPGESIQVETYLLRHNDVSVFLRLLPKLSNAEASAMLKRLCVRSC